MFVSQKVAGSRRRTASILLIVFAAVLLGAFIVLKFFVIPAETIRRVSEQSVLIEGSRSFELWKDPKYTLKFTVWLYTVLNPDDVLTGARPHVQKRGPYSYDKIIHNEIKSSEGGRLTFKRRTLYYFNKTDSCQNCTESDSMVVPSIFYQLNVESASRPRTSAAARALLAQSPFLNLTVAEILFQGYNDPYLHKFCSLPLLQLVCETVFDMPDKFGLFVNMNDTYAEGEYTIRDGSLDISTRGDVITYNGRPELKKEWWTSEEARRIRGSESTIFHPFIARGELLWTLSHWLCRSIPLTYVGESIAHGVPSYSFQIAPDVFDSSKAGMEGFCHPTEKEIYPSQRNSSRHCYPKGVIQGAACRRNSPPIVLSLPNFAHASEEIQNAVVGLDTPNDERDLSVIDIEPNLGIVMRARRHILVNFEFWAGTGIKLPAYHDTMSSALIPLALVADDADIDPETLSMINSELIVPMRMASICTTILLVLAIISLVATALIFIHQCGSRKTGSTTSSTVLQFEQSSEESSTKNSKKDFIE